ncbi:MAG: addiction module protein [Gemmatimonadales bacterium]
MSSPAFDYRHLTIAERLELVGDIWDSIAEDADATSLPLSDDEKALLDKRLADLEANPSDTAPWSEVRRRLLDRLR